MTDHKALAESVTATAQAALTVLQEISLENQEDFDWAGEAVKAVKTKHDEIEALRTSLTRPLLDSKGRIDALFKPALVSLKAQEAALKDKIARYMASQEAVRVAAMQSSAALYQAGGTPTAIIPEAPQVQGITVTQVWDFEVTDPDEVPRKFCCPDLAKIKAALPKKVDSNPGMPGIRYFLTDRVRVVK